MRWGWAVVGDGNGVSASRGVTQDACGDAHVGCVCPRSFGDWHMKTADLDASTSQETAPMREVFRFPCRRPCPMPQPKAMRPQQPCSDPHHLSHGAGQR